MLNSDVLILGNGPCAHRVVANLQAHELSVIQVILDECSTDDPPAMQATPSAPPIQALEHTRLQRLLGAPDDFHVRLENQSGTADVKTRQIVIAEETVRTACFTEYGLEPSANVTFLSQYNELASAIASGSVVFLVGLVKESNPVITKEVMLAALEARAAKRGHVYILTRNLKVAEEGLEALYRKTKDAGVTYLKFTDTSPVFDQPETGNVTIAFEDEYTREPFLLAPDLLVVDETIRPSSYLSVLADILKLHTDQDGFIQRENVHRVGIHTNRRGIFAVGPARGVETPEMHMTDADDVSLAVAQHLLGDERSSIPTAEINPRRCVRCLTCFRLCPYGAIQLDTRVKIMPTACEGCGLCRAECPQQAISLEPLEHETLINEANIAPSQDNVALNAPHIVAFCCSRSAVQAGRMANWLGWEAPPGLKIVQVPCAGGISIRHILGAFEIGANGVLVLSCHTDNCHSEYGNRYARARVTQLQSLLLSIGINPDRLAIRTLASNMGVEFAEIVNQFERVLKG